MKKERKRKMFIVIGMDINNKAEWVRCPVCGNKTRIQIGHTSCALEWCVFLR